MNKNQAIRLFGFSNIAIESAIQRLERSHDIDLGHRHRQESEKLSSDYYDQFPELIRNEANSMAKHYQLFYCLENYIRDLIKSKLEDEYGVDWRAENKAVPQSVRDNAKRNMDREKEKGVTLRSANMIDYTTFGELQEIISKNFDLFGDTFTNLSAIRTIFSTLNLLRGPIAHCKPLAPDEELRLELSLKDFFRQMS
jgi:hypothetical protein